MYRDHTIGVVVPAYNEEGHVADVLDEVPEFVDRVFVVDDASTDDTWAEINEYAKSVNPGESAAEDEDEATDGDESAEAVVADGGATVADASTATTESGAADTGPEIVPIRHETNQGAGGALKTGYIRARDEGMEVTVTIDADGQMDPDIMDRFLDPIVSGEADYTKGNRFANPDYREEMPEFRQVGNQILTYLTRIASGYWRMADPQNGYTAISIEALWAIEIEEMYEYYGYCNDVLVKLNAKGMTVADVPMPAKYGDEESSITYSEYIPKVSGMLLRNFFWRLKERYSPTDTTPLAYATGTLFGLLALRSGGAALASFVGENDTADGAAESASEGSVSDSNSAGSMLKRLFVGVFAVLAGMVLDRRANEDREAHQ
ncbi:glycosyltransferase family 2 protein [Halorussus halophilus]|uniref:glycosyltransferase family 2 protein n=1 Tax=Halorussus halophilus TaxID=2650975 RepID=UPI001300E2B2|nr:glycosyltransferase family 2 protein [Halorussus halophilus]